MKQDPKYIQVLLHLYHEKEKGNKTIHYLLLRDVIFDQETVKKYSFARRTKSVIDHMVCGYMGKLCSKGFCDAEYQTINHRSSKGYIYFVGYYIRPKGVELLKQKNLT